MYLGWWIPQNGGCIENNHEAAVPEGLFIDAHKRLSIYDLQGNRQKPERVVRNGKVQALLKKVLRNERDLSFYAQPDHGGVYKCLHNTGLVHNYQLSVRVDILDTAFLEKFFAHLKSWQGCEDWEDRIEQIEKQRQQEKQTILKLIREAQLQWQESMDTLKNPGIPKTEQMKIDLANTCAGLEGKIVMLEKDLDLPANEEEEDEVTQYQIYTLLPDLIDNWSKLSFSTRLKFVGALTRKVIVSHPAPVWLKLEIHWKRPEWGIDIAHIRRRAYKAAWTIEEEAVIRELYPHADAFELLTRLPERTWTAIMGRSDQLHVFRQRGSNTTTAYRDYENASLQDVQYAEKNNLTFNGKKPQWILSCVYR